MPLQKHYKVLIKMNHFLSSEIWLLAKVSQQTFPYDRATVPLGLTINKKKISVWKAF